jgi:hypothetical protein
MAGWSPTLRICEIGGRVRLGLEGFGHVEAATLQQAADALVAHMLRIAAAVHTGGVSPGGAIGDCMLGR